MLEEKFNKTLLREIESIRPILKDLTLAILSTNRLLKEFRKDIQEIKRETEK